jgi:hypothetical protein
MKQTSLADRFWSKVENSSGADCWQWLGATHSNGYGAFSIKNMTVYAHRVAWELRRGPIPFGMFVCHRCDNPGCCNPSHLFADTNAGNLEDMVAKSRQAKGEGHGNHKLGWDNVFMIRLFAAAGESQRASAKRFGIHQTTIGRVVRKEIWCESEDDQRSMEEFFAGLFPMSCKAP